MLSINPIKIAKRKLQNYSSLPSRDYDDERYDVEKRSSFEESEYLDTLFSPESSSSFSSRVTSTSLDPMLHGDRDSSPKRKAAAYSYRNPKSYGRIFTLALGSLVVVFILTLTRLSWASARDVTLGRGRRAPPPAWEDFPFLKRYHGGIRTLVSRAENVPEYPSSRNETLAALAEVLKSKTEAAAAQQKREEGSSIPPADAFNPYPDYASDEYRLEHGSMQECFLDVERTIRVPNVLAYNGVPQGFPENVMGSYSIFGLRNDVCFERFGRLGPYGLGYSRKTGGSGAGMEGDREGADAVWAKEPEVDFTEIKWGEAQGRCMESNKHRFKARTRDRNHFYQAMATGGPDDQPPSATSGQQRENNFEMPAKSSNDSIPLVDKTVLGKKLLPRTAIVIRTWHVYKYDDEDLMFLRSLINELSIKTGGEYTVHFLIHVQDDNLPIWSDDATYQRVLNDALPAEFAGMGTLWSERQMGLIYGGIHDSMYRNLPVHGAYRSTYMPVQYFAHQHPEYEYFWQWEMDVRYTGHWYHLFTQITQWAAAQPRKGLWERNGRFYVPSIHGEWDDFKAMVRVQTEHGTASKSNIYSKISQGNPNLPEHMQPHTGPEKPIWGPEPPLDDEIDLEDAPKPTKDYEDDKYEWGVGEEADLIVLNPLFDPQGTNWILAEDVTGYNTTRGLPPRRTAIVTTGRLSRRLLETMHKEVALHRHTMFSEMWPASTALHHGLKAVYAPHPVYIDRRWPTDYLAAIFNGGRNGASGGSRLSVFSDERQHNFRGTTWYYDAGHAPNVWKRWLGYRVDGDGGEEWEMANEGRMCVPAMLLHPVKQVDMIYEHREGE